MPPWLLPAIGGALCVAAHYLLLRAASGRLGDTLGALVLETTAALGIAAAYVTGLKSAPVPTTRAGILYAVASGVCISGASILLFMTLRRGGAVATTGAMVLGGGVAISALLAPWLFQESFTPRRALGVALGVLAMIVLSRDPGAAP